MGISALKQTIHEKVNNLAGDTIVLCCSDSNGDHCIYYCHDNMRYMTVVTSIMSERVLANKLAETAECDSPDATAEALMEIFKREGWQIVKKEVMSREEEKSLCTCQGFYKPSTCPIHGIKTQSGESLYRAQDFTVKGKDNLTGT